MTDGFRLRRGAVDAAVPLLTDLKTAIFTCAALHKKWILSPDCIYNHVYIGIVGSRCILYII